MKPTNGFRNTVIFIIVLGVLSSASLLAAPNHQPAVADSLLIAAQRLHDKGIDSFRKGDKAGALEAFNSSTRMFRQYQDLLAGNRDSIRILFESFLSKEPNSPVLNYLVGRLTQTGQSDSVIINRAAVYHHRAVELLPSYAWPSMALAAGQLSLEQYDQAARFASNAIAADSLFLEAYQNLLNALKRMDDAKEITRIRKIVIEKFPGTPYALGLTMEQILSMSDPEEKKQLLLRIVAPESRDLGRGFATVELLKHLRGYQPDSALAMAQLIMGSSEKPTPQIAHWANLILFDNVKKGHQRERQVFVEKMKSEGNPELLKEIGMYYLDSLKFFRESAEILQRAYDAYTPETVRILMWSDSPVPDNLLKEFADEIRTVLALDLSRAYDEVQQYDLSEQYAEVSIQPTSRQTPAKAFFHRAKLHERKKETAKAIERLSSGLVIERDPEALKSLERLLRKTGSQQMAAAAIMEARLKKAKLAPDFKLASLSGDFISLAGLRGKAVLVDFWATWCGPCIAEMPYLQKLHEKYATNPDFVLLSISVDKPPTPVKSFIEKKKYTWTILFNEKTDEAYEVGGIPTKFLIGRDGKIYNKHVGFGGDGEKMIASLSEEINELLKMPQSKR